MRIISKLAGHGLYLDADAMLQPALDDPSRSMAPVGGTRDRRCKAM